MGEIDAAEALAEVLLVEVPDALDLPLQGFLQRARQQGDAILMPLAVADDEMPLAEVDILDPEAEAFQQP
jgi:hypothetical protein